MLLRLFLFISATSSITIPRTSRRHKLAAVYPSRLRSTPVAKLEYLRLARDYCDYQAATRAAEQRTRLRRRALLRFKCIVGISYNDYVTRVRIERSKELLRTTTLKIARISQLVGYEDQGYFCNVFKKVTGVSPSSYRI
ncbi:Helix-turn-helix domain-containing protein [Paenibacillus catalpae]|uniref:Helix-turn-helix domain-containing protein n=1 Tax=Paenibacillus catalpae TaxID=1045775 RepID=A0A1I2D5V4_9BACL|nr:helix-turn-helix transcriptional regulator [Paenibacillus catalpae]SFE75917.1 Helix-turn-helix domain-containing protein [Paenibacillus catalpae]